MYRATGNGWWDMRESSCAESQDQHDGRPRKRPPALSSIEFLGPSSGLFVRARRARGACRARAADSAHPACGRRRRITPGRRAHTGRGSRRGYARTETARRDAVSGSRRRRCRVQRRIGKAVLCNLVRDPAQVSDAAAIDAQAGRIVANHDSARRNDRSRKPTAVHHH